MLGVCYAKQRLKHLPYKGSPPKASVSSLIFEIMNDPWHQLYKSLRRAPDTPKRKVFDGVDREVISYSDGLEAVLCDVELQDWDRGGGFSCGILTILRVATAVAEEWIRRGQCSKPISASLLL